MKKVLYFALALMGVVLMGCERNTSDSDGLRYEGGILRVLRFKDADFIHHAIAYHTCEFMKSDSTEFAFNFLEITTPEILPYRGSIPPFIVLHNNYVLIDWRSHYNRIMNIVPYNGAFNSGAWYFLPQLWSEIDTTSSIIKCEPAITTSVADQMEVYVYIHYHGMCRLMGIPISENPEDVNYSERWKEYCETSSEITERNNQWFQEYVDALNELIDQGDEVFWDTMKTYGGQVINEDFVKQIGNQNYTSK